MAGQVKAVPGQVGLWRLLHDRDRARGNGEDLAGVDQARVGGLGEAVSVHFDELLPVGLDLRRGGFMAELTRELLGGDGP